GPTTARNPPGSTVRLTSFSTVSGCPPLKYTFVRFCAVNMARILAAIVVVCALRTACRKPEQAGRQPPSEPDRVDGRPIILFVGTSLTAGLGVDPDAAFPAVIQRRLDSLHLA